MLGDNDAQTSGVALLLAAETNPDEAAKDQQLARRFGVPPGAVTVNRDAFKRTARSEEAQPVLDASPKLAASIARRPQAAPILHDSLEEMGLLEGLVKSITQPLGKAVRDPGGTARRMIGGLDDVLMGRTSYDIASAQGGMRNVGRALGAGTLDIAAGAVSAASAPVNWATRALRFGEPVEVLAADIKAQADKIAPKLDDPYVQAALDGVRSIPVSLLSGLVTLATRNPALGASVAGVTTGGASYLEGREAGLGDATAATYGAIDAALEIGTEYLGNRLLANDLAADSAASFGRILFRQMLAEQPTEQVATITQDFNRWAFIEANQGKTFGDYLDERGDAAVRTAIATAVGVGATTSIITATDRVLRAATGQQRMAEEASAVRDAFATLLQNAAASKVLARDPETFRQTLADMAEDTPGETVFLSPDALESLAQSGVEIDALLPSAAAGFDEARMAGHDVAVPLAELLTAAASNESFGQAVLDHVKLDPAGMSKAEAETFMASDQAKALADEIAQVVAREAEAEAADAGRAAVEARVMEMLTAARRHTDAVNKIYASHMANFYTVLAGRLGRTPEEVFERFPVRIEAAPVASGFVGQAVGQNVGETGDDNQLSRRDAGGARPAAGAGTEASGLSGDAGGRAGLSGSAGLLGRAPGPGAGDAGSGDGRPGGAQPLPGSPATAFAGRAGRVEVQGFAPARAAAEAYATAAGLPFAPPAVYAAVDTERAARIAQAYTEMAHAPTDPEVKASYDAMVAETLAQWQAIKATGLQVEFIAGENPYSVPYEAIIDVRENNHLWVFPTDDGYGGDPITDADVAQNPLLALVPGEEISGRPVRVNDIFRIVHDYFGHVKDGHGFGPTGEENAWQSHVTMYSPLAARAMTTETRGQNSWVNYGPLGEQNRADPTNTTYAEQKIGLLPEWVSTEGRVPAKEGVYGQDITQDTTQDGADTGGARSREVAVSEVGGGGRGVGPSAAARIGWTPERIDRLIREHAVSYNDNTNAYAVMMSPQAFLDLTLSAEGQARLATFDPSVTRARPLDLADLEAESQTPFLIIPEPEEPDDFQKTNYGLTLLPTPIYGHEGRHRMMALREAGFTQVPVVIIVQAERAQRDDLPAVELSRQSSRLSPYNNGVRNAQVGGLIPVNQANRERLIEMVGGADVLFQDTFYSPLERAVEGIGFARAPAAQWLATIRKTPGVKKDELEWTGLPVWLETRAQDDPNAPVTRDEVLAFVRNNGVQLEETILSEDAEYLELDEDLERDYMNKAYNDWLLYEWDGAINTNTEIEEVETGDVDMFGDPVFEERVVERFYVEYNDGRQTMQEGPFDTSEEAEEALNTARDEAWERAVGGGWEDSYFDDAYEQQRERSSPRWDTYRTTPREGESYTELLLRLPPGAAGNPKTSPSTHWREPGVVAHVRFDIRRDLQGRKVLMIHEIQSDWHQKGRDQGYKTALKPEERARLEGELAVAQAEIDRLKNTPEYLSWMSERTALQNEENELYDQRRNMTSEAYQSWEDRRRSIAARLGAVLDRKPYTTDLLRLNDTINSLRIKLDSSAGIPDAPFKGTGYAALLLRRMIAYAVDKRIDRIAWIRGEQQNGEEDAEGGWFYDRVLINVANDVLKPFRGKDAAPVGRGDYSDPVSVATRNLEKVEREIADYPLQLSENELSEQIAYLTARVAELEQTRKDNPPIQRAEPDADGLRLFDPNPVGEAAKRDQDAIREQAKPLVELAGLYRRRAEAQDKLASAKATEARSRARYEQAVEAAKTQLAGAREALAAAEEVVGESLAEIRKRRKEQGTKLDLQEQAVADAQFAVDEAQLRLTAAENALLDREARAGRVYLIDGINGMETAEEDRTPGHMGFDVTQAMADQARDGFSLFQSNRGAFSPATSTITLLEAADLSTFLHEAAHFFLETYIEVASDPGAPPDIVADIQAFFKWAGVKDLAEWKSWNLDQRREAHEKWARGFEKRLMSGRSPSLRLDRMFATFRAWLVAVYRRAKNLRVNVSPEVRAVMDRMLASDAEIAEAEAARSMLPLFRDRAASGMSEDAWRAYQELGVAATREAQDELANRSMRDMQWLTNARSQALKDLQRQARTVRARVRREVTAEVMARPENRAREFLKRGMIDGRKVEGGYKLAIAEVDAMLGDAPAAKAVKDQLGYGKYGMLGTENGIHPQQVAELFGFADADALLRALLNAPDPKAEIDGLTEQRLLEEYGDLTDPVSIERAADKAVHNEARGRFVASELAALTKAIGKPNILARAARSFAEASIARLRIRDLRPARYTAAEARAAKAAMTALASGNLAAAAAEKRNQLINFYSARAAIAAGVEVEKALAYFAKFGRESTRKAIDPDYRDQIDQLLERFDLRVGQSLKAIDRRKSLAAWVEQQRERGFEPVVPDYLLEAAGRTHFRDMTVEELRGLVDTVKNIEHLGRLKTKLLTARRERDFEKAVSLAEASILDNATREARDAIESNQWIDRARSGVASFFAMHRKFASLIRTMDGFKDGGPLWELFVRGMNAAGDTETRMRAEATRALHDILKPLWKAGSLRKKLFIPEIGRSLSLEGRLAVALNMGNETNRLRLNEGDRWSASQIDAIGATLTAEQWQVVQAVWDYIDSYWPQIAAKERRVSGVVPERVERTPFTITTADGQTINLAGGYYPIKYDPNRSSKAEADEAAEQVRSAMQGLYTRATTRRGHTQARVESVKRPVRKDLGVIFQHVTEVTHDLAWHEWLIDANRLLRAGPIDAAIRAYYGPEVLRAMRAALADMAAGEVGAQNTFEAAVNHLRTGTTIAGLGWNLMTTLLQPLGLFNSVRTIGPKWVGVGIARVFKDAASLKASTTWIKQRSEFMAGRVDTQQREINEIRNKVMRDQNGVLTAVQDSFFYFISRAQLMADVPTWIGAYERAMASPSNLDKNGNPDEARAVALADQAVIDAQGSGQTKDLAQVQRGSPLMKLFTNFYSYMNLTYNQISEEVGELRLKGPKHLPYFLIDVALVSFIPTTIAFLMREALTGGSDDEDDEALVIALIRENLGFFLGTMVGLREIGSMVSTDMRYTSPAGLRVLSDAAGLKDQIVQGEADEALWRAVNRVAGAVLHYPAGQVDRTVRGFRALADGETSNPLVLLVGPERKAS
jgi:hypothetical protein